MKPYSFTIQINQPVAVVFNTLTDKSVFPEWVKAWGEGMVCEGEWAQGGYVSFFDRKQGGTKVIIDELVPNALIKARHIAMVGPDNVEVEQMDTTMAKWIGSLEEYYFTADSDSQTTLKVVMITDETFEEMVGMWPQALKYLKEICEAT